MGGVCEGLGVGRGGQVWSIMPYRIPHGFFSGNISSTPTLSLIFNRIPFPVSFLLLIFSNISNMCYKQ